MSKTFNGRKVLDDLSLAVQPGEVAVLLGSSGVGKSTLLRVLNNLEKPDQGTVTLNGKVLDLANVNKAHTVGMVFQQFNLFEHLTVIENISLILELTLGTSHEQATREAQTLLDHWGLGDKALLHPSSLSGGQKQRLALARTLALKPKVICLDEPTSALDPMLTSAVATTIMQLALQGYTLLVATHDTSLLERLNCSIHLMDQGRIVESAPSAELTANPEKYDALRRFIAGT